MGSLRNKSFRNNVKLCFEDRNNNNILIMGFKFLKDVQNTSTNGADGLCIILSLFIEVSCWKVDNSWLSWCLNLVVFFIYWKGWLEYVIQILIYSYSSSSYKFMKLTSILYIVDCCGLSFAVSDFQTPQWKMCEVLWSEVTQ